MQAASDNKELQTVLKGIKKAVKPKPAAKEKAVAKKTTTAAKQKSTAKLPEAKTVKSQLKK